MTCCTCPPRAMQHADEVIIVCGTGISLNIVTNSCNNCVPSCTSNTLHSAGDGSTNRSDV